jgi:hypothetical protein
MDDHNDLAKDMRIAAAYFESLPDDHEFSMEDTDQLEEIRHQAIALKMAVEAIFSVLNGNNQ